MTESLPLSREGKIGRYSERFAAQAMRIGVSHVIYSMTP